MIFIYFCGNINKDKKIDKSLFDIIENIIIVLSIVSMIFWMFSLLGLSPNVITTIKWGGIHQIYGYYFIHFIPQMGNFNFLGLNLYRNTGIFVEAPIYSYILSTVLIVHLFIKKNDKIFDWKIIILLFTIFSTTSTTGILIVTLSIFFAVLNKYNNIVYKFIIILFLPTLYYIIKYIFYNKMDSVGTSYNIREYEWNLDLVAWKNHLIIGNGLPGLHSDGSVNSFGNIGLSSGFMACLAYGGILLLIIYILPSVLTIIFVKNLRIPAILLLVMFVLTIILNQYIYILILSYFYFCFFYRKLDQS